VARNLRRLLEGSQIRESHRDCARVQDAYSLRCMPQVHGAVRDTLAFCRRVFEIEMNSAVDNPLVFPGGAQPGAAMPRKSAAASDAILSGGNFHGQPLAFALDFLAIALTTLAGISERRVERLVNPALNEGLPAFLAKEPGLNSGFMMAQVTAAALASENKVLAHPASADSIPTSGNKEDYVSMGMGAALKLKKILANATHVLAIEAVAAAQGIDFLAPLQTSKRLQVAYAAVRAAAPAAEKDHSPARDFARVAALLGQGKLSTDLH
jgi:histidine ammonia-lyase